MQYDINYKNSSNNTLCPVSYSFVDADAGTLPQSVLDLLPAGSEAGIGSIVIPKAPASNIVEIPNNGGTWKFLGWDKNQVNILQEGVEFIGTWKYTAPVNEETPMPEPEDPDKDSNTRTSDTSALYLFSGLMILSLAILFMILRRRSE